MKKRKELDALVSNGKSRCGGSGKKLATSAVSNCPSSQELLNNDCSDTTDTEELRILRARKSLNGRKASRLYAMCMPVCILTLVTASVVGSAMLIWMHLGLRQEVDMLRNYFRKVEAGTRKTPEEFHIVHTRLNLLEGNTTANRDSILKISDSLTDLSKNIETLRKTTASISKSIAAAPQIETLPRTVQSLEQNVASLGSKITNLETIFKELKEQTGNMNKDLQNNIGGLQKKVDKISNTSQMTTTTTTSQSFIDGHLLQEQLNHLGTVFQNLNESTNGSFSETFNKLHYLQGNFSHVHNLSHELREKIESLEEKVIILDDIPLQVNELVQKDLNETIENFLTTKSAQTETNTNTTVKQALAYISSLRQLYHELLIIQSQYKQMPNKTFDDIISMEVRQAEQVKNVSRQLDKLWQYVNQLKNEQTLTSSHVSELIQRLEIIRASLHSNIEIDSYPLEETKITSTGGSSILVNSIFNSSVDSVKDRTISP